MHEKLERIREGKQQCARVLIELDRLKAGGPEARISHPELDAILWEGKRRRARTLARVIGRNLRELLTLGALPEHGGVYYLNSNQLLSYCMALFRERPRCPLAARLCHLMIDVLSATSDGLLGPGEAGRCEGKIQ